MKYRILKNTPWYKIASKDKKQDYTGHRHFTRKEAEISFEKMVLDPKNWEIVKVQEVRSNK